MPSFVLHSSSIVLCTHFGQAKPILPSLRVTLSGQPLVTIGSPYVITACGLTGTTTPPCVTGKLTAGSVRVTSDNLPLGLLNSPTTCIPTGTPMLLLLAQFRVVAT